jgi:hypothetical protein
MNVVDLRSYLESWPYDARKNVRLGRGADGREIILVRQPMGLEQYEADGRPDGRRAHGARTIFDSCHARVHEARQTQPAMVFELSAEDCAELFLEASAYYHRLTVLFRLQDWTRVRRDAEQIVRLLEFVKQHAPRQEGRTQFDAWPPHIARIHALACSMIHLDARQSQDAFQTARDTMSLPVAAEDGAPGRGTLWQTWLENAQGSPPIRALLHTHKESSFLRQGDYWEIRYHGQTALLKAARGLQYLACLLGCPAREFHVSELIASQMEAQAGARAVADRGRVYRGEHRRIIAGLNDGSPVLDTQAKEEYKRRLSELREEIEEAERFNDSDRAAKAQEEMNMIARHMASAVGLGGRDRKTSSGAERARCAVTKSIKKSIQKIGHSIPLLGHYLAAKIKTGYFCSYIPHPDRPEDWKF